MYNWTNGQEFYSWVAVSEMELSFCVSRESRGLKFQSLVPQLILLALLGYFFWKGWALE